MVSKVLAAINRFSMINGGDNITVALSGGADSMALLHLLYSNRERLGITLCAAHLNHSLRGAESDCDENFVREYCGSIGVELFCEKADVGFYAEQSGKSTEEAAREIRYDFLARVSSGKVATAHTASDNAETVLINLSRGTALKGVCGIPPVRDNFIRPLIFCSRAEIEDYCRENGIPFVTDSSNLSDDYTRNKIRHNVIPVLQEINPSLCSAVTRFTLSAGEDCEYLQSVADAEYLQHLKNGKLTVPCDMSPAIAKRMIARYLDDIGCVTDSLHINEIYEALGDKTRRSVSGDKSILIDKQTIFSETDAKRSFIVSMLDYDREKFDSCLKVNKLLLNNAIDCDKICGKVVLRTREAGDEIKLSGRGTKSLKKLYNELKIPQNDRENLPLAADDNGVIWVYGAGVCERVRVDRETKQITVFEVKERK
ncbi:MAG: tRNA lysidine(34) synthetase TilS [Ruminococcaceae bacterium]|nr:tRNA lysidine(34) synthetase TilS [Oscillospiraceae bacterium]